MNKEDILKILEGAKDKNGDVPMRLVRQAFEKLSESCTDIISRQAAIDVIEAGRLTKLIEAEVAVNGLKALPSARPKQQWISPKERLPEKYQRVLVTIYTKRNGAQVRSGMYYDGYFNNDNGDCWKHTDKEVKAWVPLPEPYMAEEA